MLAEAGAQQIDLLRGAMLDDNVRAFIKVNSIAWMERDLFMWY